MAVLSDVFWDTVSMQCTCVGFIISTPRAVKDQRRYHNSLGILPNELDAVQQTSDCCRRADDLTCNLSVVHASSTDVLIAVPKVHRVCVSYQCLA